MYACVYVCHLAHLLEHVQSNKDLIRFTFCAGLMFAGAGRRSDWLACVALDLTPGLPQLESLEYTHFLKKDFKSILKALHVCKQ